MKQLAMILTVAVTVPVMAGPQINIAEKHWDYGFVPQNGVLTHYYTIRNTGDDTLIIADVKPGCSCTAAPINNKRIPPGDSAQVGLIFDTKVSRGKVSKNAQINSNDPVKGSERIDFTCTVYADSGYFRPVKIDPHHLEFTPNNAKFEIVVQNDTGSTLELTQVGNLPSDLRLKIRDNIIKVGKKGEFTLERKGAQPEFDIDGVITFDTNAELIPRFTIPFTIKGVKGAKPPERLQETKSVGAQPTSSQIGNAIASPRRQIDNATTQDTSAVITQPIGK